MLVTTKTLRSAFIADVAGTYVIKLIVNDGTMDSTPDYVIITALVEMLKWSYDAKGAGYSSPTIGNDGTIYVGSSDGNLYAINSNGTLKWKYVTESQVNSPPTIGDDGTIYVGSDDYYLYAIDPDGTLKWKYATASYVQSYPAIGTDGTIYVGTIYVGNDLYVSGDKNFYAINPDGTLKWSYYAGSPDTSSPPVGVESSPAIGSDGTIYVGSNDGNLYAIFGSSGLANSPWPMRSHDVRHTGGQ
jgi:outer membrane protein assembly factor BamB